MVLRYAPEAMGVHDLNRPDYGEPAEILDGQLRPSEPACACPLVFADRESRDLNVLWRMRVLNSVQLEQLHEK
jgi:hypothetical protein